MSRSYSASGLLRTLLTVALLGPMAVSAQDRCDAPSVSKGARVRRPHLMFYNR